MRPLTRVLRAITVPTVLLAALESVVRTVASGSDAIAPPSAAAVAWIRAMGQAPWWHATQFTLTSALTGLAFGAGAGLLLGALIGLHPRAGRLSALSIELLRPIPSVALIPLAMLVFGFGLRMEASIVAFATFWPVLVLSQAAARGVEPRLLEVAQGLQMSWTARMVKIVVPAMLPRLFVALRLGLGVALVVSVTVEIAANPHGIGYAMVTAQQSLAPDELLAWLFWVGVLGAAINAGTLALQRAVERRMGISA